MNFLVTGGCGFIGSNFLNYMVPRYPNFQFVNIDVMYYCASLDNVYVQDYGNYHFIKGNINDTDLVEYILQEYKITHVVHFAAQSHVDGSFIDSFKYTEDNIKGTHNLLNAIRNVNPNIFLVHFSTDEVYGESGLNDEPKHEMCLLCPTNPYAASKASAEMLVISYIHSFNIGAIIIRCNNVYGPNQYPEKLIPKFIQCLRQGQKCTIHGTGSALRSFIHVDDVSRAVEIIIHKGTIGQVYNIGTNRHSEKSVLDVLKCLVKKIHNCDDYEKWISYIKDRPFNDKRYFITCEKTEKLGWRQQIPFEQGIDDLLTLHD